MEGIGAATDGADGADATAKETCGSDAPAGEAHVVESAVEWVVDGLEATAWGADIVDAAASGADGAGPVGVGIAGV